MKPYIKSIIASSLIIFACLGLGRFSFGMVLPNMQETLNITTTQIGFVGTTNFIGYIIGILFTNYLYNKYSTHNLITVTISLQAFSMFIMTFFSDYLFISFFYAISGFFSAVANISVMSYMAKVIPKEIRGKVLGIVVGANGFAIVLVGQIVPIIEATITQMPWKTSWSIFALILLLIAFFSRPGIRKHATHKVVETKIKAYTYFKIFSFWKISFIYMLFGISYSIYVTYFVSAIIDKYQVTTSLSGDFWAVLGFCSIFSGFLFGIIADKVGPFKSLIFAYTLQMIAHSILVINIDSSFIWLSAIAFGFSVWSIPSLVTLLISMHFDVNRTAQVLSLATLLFALCQALGPISAGYIFDVTNDFSSVFMLTSILTLIAVVLSFIFSKQEIKQIH